MTTRVVTAHIPEELAEKVDGYAKSMERSRGWIVRQALANWIGREEHKLRLSLEALDAAEKGDIVEDEDVAAWAASLDTDKPLPPPAPRKR